ANQVYTSKDPSTVQLTSDFFESEATGSAAPPEVPEDSNVTVSPLAVHASLLESVFDVDDEFASASPMFSYSSTNDAEPESWESLFTDDEITVKQEVQEAAKVSSKVEMCPVIEEKEEEFDFSKARTIDQRSFSASVTTQATVEEIDLSQSRSFSTSYLSRTSEKRSFSTASESESKID
ncbi:hypothetical protein OFN08_18365, partial [Acinetobacter baumannii]|nr:hypothetical protein [Acinetobacter baumannii]